MEKIRKIQSLFLNKELTAQEALDKVFAIYCIKDEHLAEHNLEIKYAGYGMFQLRQSGEFLCESDESSCLEVAYEIINKN